MRKIIKKFLLFFFLFCVMENNQRELYPLYYSLCRYLSSRDVFVCHKGLFILSFMTCSLLGGGVLMLKALKFLLYSLRSRYMFFPQSDSRRNPDPVGKSRPHLRNNSCLFLVGWRSNYTSKHTLFQRKRRTEHIGSKWGRYNHQPL